MKFTHYFALLSIVFLIQCSDNSPTSSNPDNGNPNNPEPETYSHTQRTGSAAVDFLSDSEFTSLTLEVDYVEGFKPTSQAISALQNFLETYLNKPDGITINLDEPIPLSGKDTLTVQDVVDMENQYRSTFTSGSDLGVYMIIPDGVFERENVLGFAYYNTSVAILEERIRQISGGFGEPSTSVVETAVMNHEIGHLLGLVANGTPATSDHHDEENGAHCTNDACLMYFAVQSAGFMGNLLGSSAPGLDQACIQDLQANAPNNQQLECWLLLVDLLRH